MTRHLIEKTTTERWALDLLLRALTIEQGFDALVLGDTHGLVLGTSTADDQSIELAAIAPLLAGPDKALRQEAARLLHQQLPQARGRRVEVFPFGVHQQRLFIIALTPQGDRNPERMRLIANAVATPLRLKASSSVSSSVVTGVDAV